MRSIFTWVGLQYALPTDFRVNILTFHLKTIEVYHMTYMTLTLTSEGHPDWSSLKDNSYDSVFENNRNTVFIRSVTLTWFKVIITGTMWKVFMGNTILPTFMNAVTIIHEKSQYNRRSETTCLCKVWWQSDDCPAQESRIRVTSGFMRSLPVLWHHFRYHYGLP